MLRRCPVLRSVPFTVISYRHIETVRSSTSAQGTFGLVPDHVVIHQLGGAEPVRTLGNVSARQSMRGLALRGPSEHRDLHDIVDQVTAAAHDMDQPNTGRLVDRHGRDSEEQQHLRDGAQVAFLDLHQNLAGRGLTQPEITEPAGGRAQGHPARTAWPLPVWVAPQHRTGL